MSTTPPLAAVSGLAWALEWRAPSPRQRVIAGVLTWLLGVNVAGPWLASGSDLDVAAFASWHAVIAGAVWRVLKSDEPETFAPGSFFHLALMPSSSGRWRSRFGVLLSRAVPFRSGSSAADLTPILLLVAVLASPIAYRHGLDVARASFALALAAQLLAALRFASRGKMPDGPQAVALILALSSLADAFGPWLFGQPDRDWPLARWISVVTWTVVSGVQIWNLLRRRTA